MRATTYLVLAIVLVLVGFGLAGDTPVSVTPVPAASGSMCDPQDFRRLDPLILSPGQSITFFTGTTNDMPYVDGGGFNMVTGQVAESESGEVRLAAFCFSRISIASNVSITVTGDLGLVLLSRTKIELGSELNADGRNVPSRTVPGAEGGPGAEDGESGVSYRSNPPGETRGNGSDGLGHTHTGTTEPGSGRGGGGGSTVTTGGTGGSYGGRGGIGAGGNTQTVAAVYGDLMVADLFGGSGASGARSTSAQEPGMGGGGGGGSVSLVANSIIHVKAGGSISASGGAGGDAVHGDANGGGGSGGGILLVARTVILEGTLSATGGRGGDGEGKYYGGGGGRIALYSDDSYGGPGQINPGEAEPIPNVYVGGGRGGTNEYSRPSPGFPGSAGTFYDGRRPTFIEKGVVITVL